MYIYKLIASGCVLVIRDSNYVTVKTVEGGINWGHPFCGSIGRSCDRTQLRLAEIILKQEYGVDTKYWPVTTSDLAQYFVSVQSKDDVIFTSDTVIRKIVEIERKKEYSSKAGFMHLHSAPDAAKKFYFTKEKQHDE